MRALVVMVAFISVLLAQTWYVKPNGNDPSDCNGGRSWNDAFATIQKALACASSGDEIWVAEGDYVISSTININKSIGLYGGFSGSESERSQRDWRNNITKIDANGAAITALRVVGVTNVIVDGFEITGAKKGGVYFHEIDNHPAILRNCKIYDNRYTGLDGNGGGVHISYASVWIENCEIFQNFASIGGGIFFLSVGDGDYDNDGNPDNSCRIINSKIHNNRADKSGGIHLESYASPVFINTAVYKNSAGDGYAMVVNSSCIPWFVNSVFYNNRPDPANPQPSESIIVMGNSRLNIINSIVWEGATGAFSISSNSELNITYSDIEGGYAGTGNIDQDPKFVDANGGDFHLLADSPCRDVGNNMAPYLSPVDIDGEPRIMNGRVDMGVDEFLVRAEVTVPLSGSYKLLLLALVLMGGLISFAKKREG